MIIIFDTFSGLCNQFYDINCGINFCLIHNIKFTFRYCSFREINLTSWHNERFEKLFDISFLDKYNNLYINYDTLNVTQENTYNFEGEVAIKLFTDNYFNEIMNIDKEFIVLKQFWSVHKFSNIIEHDINRDILPSKRLIDVYNKIKPQIIHEEYNYIHYRYEHDFTSYFQLTIQNLKDIILNIKNSFKNPNLKIYIATSNIKEVLQLDDPQLRDIILTKNNDELTDYNFEEKAFIDYMFGLHSNEVFGHKNSSFSHMLNNLKGTTNFYA